MAPTEGLAVLLLEIRQDDAAERKNATNLTDNQVLGLEAVSLSFATISVFAAFIAFYWFVRMRRSFRQDLIMLLIQSDMMKAFWLMLSPIIYFISGPDGPISTNSAYCQIQGFFLTTAIEASDFAVLMIAAHSALYILRSQRPGGETGLHPYRWYAYALWLVVPIVLAAIVPITGARFEDNGPFCYLPQQNNWYRVYLSWVPRYIIFGVILIVYTFLYIYIAWRFRRLRQDQRRASCQSSPTPKNDRRILRAQDRDLLPTPPLVHHGLLYSSSLHGREGQRSRQHSVTSEVSTLKLPDYSPAPIAPRRAVALADEAFDWDWRKAEYDSSMDSSQQYEETSSTIASPTAEFHTIETHRITTPAPICQSRSHPVFPTVKSSLSEGTSSHHSASRHFWQRPQSSDNKSTEHSASTALDVLQRGPTDLAIDTPNSSLPSLYMPMSFTEETLRKSRKKMNRQLRLLFVYPAIYIVAWIAPFISQIYRYEASPWNSVAPQPFGLFMVSIASLCIGAAVDCCFYSAWEKPWRHSKCGFWEGLALRLKIRRRPHGVGGRTREEERRDATAAIDRRNVEQADREAAAALQRANSAKAPRQWWDIDDDYEL